jgi:hypothetical protein
MGAWCGPTSTCNESLPEGDAANQYPGCMNAACESESCLGLAWNSGAIAFRNVCSTACQIYKDSDSDGINDEDAPTDDCNPPDIVDGPAGNKFRCVNFGEPGRPFGFCVPGSTFDSCGSSADCPAGESCEITNAIDGGQNMGQRCMAAYRENASWSGKVAPVAGACGGDPENGNPIECADGLCFGFGLPVGNMRVTCFRRVNETRQPVGILFVHFKADVFPAGMFPVALGSVSLTLYFVLCPALINSHDRLPFCMC